MPRYTKKTYRRQVLLLMAIYLVLILLVFPQVRHVTTLPWKVVLAIIPALPVIAVICLMARLVMHSDELDQRVHLMALSAATGTVAALSLVGGFLCTAGVIALNGDILIWVFPALCLSYGGARWLFGRRYGGMDCG